MRVIAGTAGGLRLQAPRGADTRPTSDRVKESLFAMLAPYLGGAEVLDLYAGSGALGIEALSRGAARAVFVDRAQAAVAVIRRNLAYTGLAGRAEVQRDDVLAALRRLAASGARFDVILADPPYGSGLALRTLEAVGELGILARGGRLVIEHERKEEMPDEAQNLKLSRRALYGDTAVSIYAPAGGPGAALSCEDEERSG